MRVDVAGEETGSDFRRQDTNREGKPESFQDRGTDDSGKRL